MSNGGVCYHPTASQRLIGVSQNNQEKDKNEPSHF
nr:MAG TPA: hypothetical protein [Caudoviricetes sp.]